MTGNEPELKIFIWLDELGKINVSITRQSKQELELAFDWEPNERLLLELPFSLKGAEGLSEESPENYYQAIEGLLALNGIVATIENFAVQMVEAGVSLAKHLPANTARVN